jgi:hypothetical protein
MAANQFNRILMEGEGKRKKADDCMSFSQRMMEATESNPLT